MTTREALRSAVAEIVDEVMEARDADGVEPSGEEVARRVLRAVVETLGEPVAWVLQSDYGETGEWTTDDWTDDPAFRDRWLADDKFGPGRAVPLIPLSALLDSVEPATDG